jgi:hypothetical protein
MKKLITLFAIAGMFLALAPTAQAATLTVDNFSFESPDQSGDNSGAIPTDWTRVGISDSSGLEGRAAKHGATDGVQVMMLDDRSGGADFVIVTSTSIGTGAALKLLGDTLTITFDARHGAMDGEADATDSTVTFDAFVSIGGVKDLSNNFTTDMGASSLLRKATPIFNDTGLTMDTFSFTVPTASMGDADAIAINFGQSWTSDNGVRNYVDNVRAEVTALPPAGTVLIIR